MTHSAEEASDLRDWFDEQNAKPLSGTEIVDFLAELKRGGAWPFSREAGMRLMATVFAEYDKNDDLRKRVSKARDVLMGM